MGRFVEKKIEIQGYGTISEYVRELIRDDQPSDNSRFDTFIAQANASGEPSPLTKGDIKRARYTVKERIAARK
jgi:Arc/MetJ-type ribon-helix-helix transcriptional regulator